VDQKLTPAIQVEQSLELQILAELRELRRSSESTGGQLRDLKSMLVGTADGAVELPHGRLVRLESRTDKAEGRIDNLERGDLRASAYWNAARVLGHIVTGLLGGATLAIVQWLIHAAK
jgi:hypothetical protein